MPDVPYIRTISRDKLAQVFRSPELVKLFETVLQQVGTTIPGNVAAVDETAQEGVTAAGAAQSAADAAQETADAALAAGRLYSRQFMLMGC
jgi:hypothetical protein